MFGCNQYEGIAAKGSFSSTEKPERRAESHATRPRPRAAPARRSERDRRARHTVLRLVRRVRAAAVAPAARAHNDRPFSLVAAPAVPAASAADAPGAPPLVAPCDPATPRSGCVVADRVALALVAAAASAPEARALEVWVVAAGGGDASRAEPGLRLAPAPTRRRTNLCSTAPAVIAPRSRRRRRAPRSATRRSRAARRRPRRPRAARRVAGLVNGAKGVDWLWLLHNWWSWPRRGRAAPKPPGAPGAARPASRPRSTVASFNATLAAVATRSARGARRSAK